MIIGRSGTVQLEEVLKAFAQAARGVVRVVRGDDERPFSTGWLITDTLVVLPDYVPAVDPEAFRNDQLLCRSSWRGSEFTAGARLVPDLSDVTNAGKPALTPDGSRAAVLRLHEPVPGRALRLSLLTARPEQFVAVFHHPQGRPAIELSLGRVMGLEGMWLEHDADTEGGSGGAPILGTDSLLVLGMHVRSNSAGHPDASIRSPVNQGLTTAALLESLHGSPAWPEIAAFHGLADAQAARLQTVRPAVEPPSLPSLDAGLLKAALCWSVDPGVLPPTLRDLLGGMIDDPDAPRWVMSGSERQQLIRAAGTLDALQKARPERTEPSPGQAALDFILSGPPFNLDEVETGVLPYLLQAVRWFAGVMPGLPTAAAVNLVLERRKVRGRLMEIAGPAFRGREAERACLRAWYEAPSAGPLVVTGIGGAGKSALAARFAVELSPDTLVLWLDFDRADLAPDDSASVLDALGEQAAVQLTGFTHPAPADDGWEPAADVLGDALAGCLPAGARPLLVLDGFEVAQHAVRHQEIWPVLDRLLLKVPGLRVVVSGRAPVRGLVLRGQEARPMHLVGLAVEDARLWLEPRIPDRAVLDRVLAISHCVPLLLKMAVRLVEAGGTVQDLPEMLPRKLIEGYLYDRILNRVIDQKLKPLARDALVLRTLGEGLLAAVLHDRIPSGLSPAEVLPLLSREFGLVEAAAGSAGTETLRLRPEVRVATLRLLEMHDLARVQEIDHRAVDYYAALDTSSILVAAELVYHWLRLGQVQQAAQAWRDGCAPLLRHADEDLPEEAVAARAWLSQRLADVHGPAQLEWETGAVQRIRACLDRGLDRAVLPILQERPDRMPGSALVIYDAWTLWQAGDLAAARCTLSEASPAAPAVTRDRAVLAALLAQQNGDRDAADTLLRSLEDEALWAGVAQGLGLLAVTAARIRLTVDPTKERALLQVPTRAGGAWDDPLRGAMWPGYVLAPALAERLEDYSAALESVVEPVSIPSERAGLPGFRRAIAHEAMGAGSGPSVPESDDPAEVWPPPQALSYPSVGPSGSLQPYELILNELRSLGWLRWWIVTESLFLVDASGPVVVSSAKSGSRLAHAILATLAAVRNQRLRWPPGPWQFEELDRIMDLVLWRTTEAGRAALFVMRQAVKAKGADSLVPSDLAVFDQAELSRPGVQQVISYLYGPDPLSQLCRHVLGIPEADSASVPNAIYASAAAPKLPTAAA